MTAAGEFVILLVELVARVLLDLIMLVAGPIIHIAERFKNGTQKDFKSILITGGNSGLGEALALAFAKPGVRIVLTARDASRLETVSKAVSAKGAEVITHSVDVTDAKKMSEVILQEDAIRPLDLVIANAGVSSGTLKIPSIADATKPLFDINVQGVFNTVFPAVEVMKQRKSGQIAIMASLASFVVVPEIVDYHSSKFAVRSFGEGLRGMLANLNIGVTVICPGFVASRMTQQAAKTISMPMFMEAEPAARIMKDGLERNVGVIAYPFPLSSLFAYLGGLPSSIRTFLYGLASTKKFTQRRLKLE